MQVYEIRFNNVKNGIAYNLDGTKFIKMSKENKLIISAASLSEISTKLSVLDNFDFQALVKMSDLQTMSDVKLENVETIETVEA